MIRTIYIFSLDISKFFPPTLNRALSIIKPTPLIINFCFIPPRPQITNKTKIGVILPPYHVIFICERAKNLEEDFIMTSLDSPQKTYIEEPMK